MTQESRFSRMDPEVRKANLVQATLTCLKRDGFQGASIRKISAEAGVSVGLISHHYSGKDELVVVTFAQDYQSNNLSNQMKKRQYWIREEGHWKIIYEGAA